MLRLYDSISLGHLDVEFFRKELDKPLSICEELIGPFPGGPSGIFVCAMSALGAKTGIIATVGEDDFGKCIVERLKSCIKKYLKFIIKYYISYCANDFKKLIAI